MVLWVDGGRWWMCQLCRSVAKEGPNDTFRNIKLPLNRTCLRIPGSPQERNLKHCVQSIGAHVACSVLLPPSWLTLLHIHSHSFQYRCVAVVKHHPIDHVMLFCLSPTPTVLWLCSIHVPYRVSAGSRKGGLWNWTWTWTWSLLAPLHWIFVTFRSCYCCWQGCCLELACTEFGIPSCGMLQASTKGCRREGARPNSAGHTRCLPMSNCWSGGLQFLMPLLLKSQLNGSHLIVL